MDQEIQSTFRIINNINLHIIEAGPSSGPLLIFLHGFPEYWFGWAKYIKYFAIKGFHVVVPDQRGYNLSDKPKKIGDYANLKLVKDIVYLIKSYSVEKAYIVGHDWGAAIAWSLGIYYASFVEKLVICNVPHPGVFMKFLKSHRSQLQSSWYMLFFQLPLIPEFFSKLANNKFLISALKTSTYKFSEKELLQYQQAWNHKGSLTGMINWYRSMIQSKRIPPKSGSLSMPVLIIWGVKDSALDYRMAKLSLEKCKDGKLVYFKDATHWVQHEMQKEIKNLLSEFFIK
ncbi:MAG: Soluble epoxide hydrolase [Candidatus Heimdallarchaeota archaeon LC_3]|nr:MAG: Soluble epoxide hydrolase [Candidatus Heimdallarchaeota archaeon LC_3]